MIELLSCERGFLMLRFLARRCIPDFQNTADPKVRQSYGILCGAVGILFNTLLCIAKLLVGILSGSIAITADALNNLSDAGSSAITLFGFRLAAQKPDTEHPFGHGRFEYIAGLIVSLIILLMGVELGKSSVEKILHPAPVAFHWTSVLVLVLSIGVKCYMAAYNRRIGKEIQSATISAAAADSLSDCLSTGAVLLGTLVAHFTGLHIDGWAGLLVAACILFTGYHAAKQRAEQQIRAGKRRGNTDINRKDIRDQPCEKRVDRHRIDRIGSKKPAQFFQTDRNRGIFNNKRKKDRDRYGGVICSSNMEVPEIPLSYNLTGVRKIVIPKAFMIPATVSISRFTTRKFLGFCTPLFR